MLQFFLSLPYKFEKISGKICQVWLFLRKGKGLENPTKSNLCNNYSCKDWIQWCQPESKHVIKGARISTLDKLSSQEMYLVLISNTDNRTTSNTFFGKLFENATLDLSIVQLSPRLGMVDTALRYF